LVVELQKEGAIALKEALVAVKWLPIDRKHPEPFQRVIRFLE
jgi:hypothetical protein